jgi:RNA polymerase sigma-70 factor (ECF subfamily)
MSAENDNALIQQIRAGNMQAWDELVKKYKNQLFAFIYHMAPNKQEAEDMFQETFFRIVKGLKNYQHQEKFLSWAMKIANNLAIDKARKGKGKQPVSLETPVFSDSGNAIELKDTLAASTGAPDEALDKKNLGQDLKQAVNELPFEQRQVFLMREKSGLTFKEISKTLNISINTALGRMHYALQHLRQKLAPTYGG